MNHNQTSLSPLTPIPQNILSQIRYIGLDADDTLWENEHFYAQAEQQLLHILSDKNDGEDILKALYKTESQNMEKLGY